MENGNAMDESMMNPLSLTLDEVIALNKARNQQNPENQSLDEIIQQNKIRNREKEQEIRDGKKKPLRNGFSKKFRDRAEAIEKRLRNNPRFGSRPIHKRLGYFPFFKKMRRRVYPTPTQAMAYRFVNKAKMIWRRMHPETENPTIIFRNPNAQQNYSPLTRTSVKQFNRRTFLNNSLASNRSAAGSAFMQAIRLPRHSVKASINPALQQAISELEVPTEIDLESLEDFKFTPDCSYLTTDERFSRYT